MGSPVSQPNTDGVVMSWLLLLLSGYFLQNVASRTHLLFAGAGPLRSGQGPHVLASVMSVRTRFVGAAKETIPEAYRCDQRFSCVLFSSAYYKETLLSDIRRAQENYQGNELVKELARIRLRMDNTEVLTSDILINLLLSYLDTQV